jgi:prephenate dehydrogenase
LLPPGVVFVGSHPMAGSHDKGVEHANPALFEGACCVLTPLADTPDAATARIRAFWEALGARVVHRNPEAHDLEVAWTSHVPHILAYAFAHALERAPESAAELAATGFADFTRIAKSDAALWGDILGANRKAIAGPLQAFSEALAELATAIERGDADEQENFLASAREQLSRIRPAATVARGDRDRAPSGG